MIKKVFDENMNSEGELCGAFISFGVVIVVVVLCVDLSLVPA
jgi:hypothetical protein